MSTLRLCPEMSQQELGFLYHQDSSGFINLIQFWTDITEPSANKNALRRKGTAAAIKTDQMKY